MTAMTAPRVLMSEFATVQWPHRYELPPLSSFRRLSAKLPLFCGAIALIQESVRLADEERINSKGSVSVCF